MNPTDPPTSWMGPADTGEAPELPPSLRPDGAPLPEGASRFSAAGRLGAGAGGEVLAGRDHRLSRDVALKVVRGDDARALARLRREAAILASLEHPGIVTLYDVIERPDGGLEIALRLIRGETLGACIAAGEDGAPGLLEHLVRAAEALGHAHARGIVHRDVKPANIMVGAFGETQVIDWGLAGPAATGDVAPETANTDTAPQLANLTQDGAVLGTPRYMSPEQARGERVTPASDVWALGLILGEILTGRTPWADLDTPAILADLRRGAPPPLPTRRGPASAALVGVMRDALRADPVSRLPDGGTFATRLREALRVGAPRPWRRAAAALLAVTGGALITIVGARRPGPSSEAPRPVEHTGAAAAAAALETLAEHLLTKAPPSEAAAAAIEALKLRETPLARGVAAAALTDLGATVVRSRAIDGPRCGIIALATDSDRRMCATAEGLWVSDGGNDPWSVETPLLDAGFVEGGEGILVQRPNRSIERFEAVSGAREGAPLIVDCTAALKAEGGPLGMLYASECLLVSDGRTVHWQVSRGPAFQSAALSADGARWAALGRDGTLHFGETDLTGPAVRPADGTVPAGMRSVPTPLAAGSLRVSAMHLSETGIVLGTHDGELLRLNEAGHILARTRVSGSPSVRSVEVRGPLLAVLRTSAGPVILDAMSLRMRATLPEDDRGALRLLGASAFETSSQTRTATWELMPALPRASGLAELGALALSGDEVFLGVGAEVHRHDEGGHTTAASFGDRWVKHLSPSPDGLALALAHPASPGLSRVDTARLTPLPTPPAPALRRVLHLEDGTLLALSYNHTLLVLPPGAPSEWLSVGGETFVDGDARGARTALLSRNGEAVLMAFDGAPVELGRCPASGARAIAITPPGDGFVLGGANGVIALSAEDCATWALFPGAFDAPIGALALSPDTSRLAAGDVAGRVWLWELASRRLEMTAPRHESRIGALAFQGPETLVSLGWDGAIRSVALPLLRLGPEALSTRL